MYYTVSNENRLKANYMSLESGIVGSETLVAFRSFSKFDLAELFDVGTESARN
mgnify:CR=1 FL=1